MDTHYHAMHQQAAAMQHMIHEYTRTNANNPLANTLRREMHGLTNDLAMNKKPQTIDHRLRTLESHIKNSQMQQMEHTAATGYSSPVLNHNQSNFLHSNFQHMRQNIRMHPKF